ncbi:alpha/beta hydrolase [Streptococcaceae bacterium ESL0687]|nr:alpha/beta hydrolase [Streptococcaceae bacterium ESL0687]
MGVIFLYLLLVIVAILIIGLGFVAWFISGAIVQKDNKWYAKVGHSLANPDIDQNQTDPYAIIERKQNERAQVFWQDKLTEKIVISSFDNLKLKANLYKVNPTSNKWIIGVHGYRSTGQRDMQLVVEQLSKNGYNFLIPDMRAHGESEGKIITMGHKESMDLLEWINLLIEREPEAEIILFGGSMGATTTMLVTNNNLPVQIKGAVADCGYTSLELEFQSLFKRVFKLPKFPIVNFMSLFIKSLAGFSIKDVDVTRSLKNNDLPILFIHGTADKFVPHQMAYQNNEATRGPKEIFMVENAPHLSSYIYEEKNYFETVNEFLNKYIWDKEK